MKKHIFVNTGERPMPDLAPNWIGYRCKFCNHLSGLDAWQMRDMPDEMAKCPQSNVRAGFWERLSGSINCLELGRTI